MNKFLPFFFFFLLKAGYGQNMPVITPLNPNQAEISKYASMPLGTFTGIPQISIPLYNIETPNFNFPLSMSYHAGGNKVDALASDVGLGWSLQTIPSITRSVNGIEDEHAQGFFNNWNYAWGSGETFLDYYQTDFDSYSAKLFRAFAYNNPYTTDLGPDVFYYNLPGESGRFMYDRSSNQFITFPKSNIKIIKIQNGFTSESLSFKIIATDGTIFIFDIHEKGFEIFNQNAGREITTSWKPSVMMSANQKDSITFEYNDEYYDNPVLIPEKKTFSDEYGGEGHYQETLIASPWTQFVRHNLKVISKINFKNGYVVFTKNSSVREDLVKKEITNMVVDPKGYSLNNVKIFNKNDFLIKQFDFKYKYISNSLITMAKPEGKWMLLTSIEEKPNSQNGNALVYYFSYNENNVPSSRRSYGKDYWGLYNGVENNEKLLPTVVFQGGNYDGANRDVNPYLSTFAILKEIKYPTGGSTEYDFESNMIDFDSSYLPPTFSKDENSNTYVGGLRIKEVRNYSDVFSLPTTRLKYKYTKSYASKKSSGLLFNDNFFPDIPEGVQNLVATLKWLGYDFFLQNAPAPYFYNAVVIKSNPTVQGVDFSQTNAIGYENVIVERDSLGVTSGYTEYKYSVSQNVYSQQRHQSGNTLKMVAFNQGEADWGNLLQTNIYKKKANDHVLVQKKNNLYDDGSGLGGVLFTEFRKKIVNNLTFLNENFDPISADVIYNHVNGYHYSAYENFEDLVNDKIYTKDEYTVYVANTFKKNLLSEETVDFFNNDSIAVKTNYFYNNYNQLIRKKSKNSSGKLQSVVTKHPLDIDINSASQAELALIEKNVIDIPIESASYIERNSNQEERLSLLKTQYNVWPQNLVLPGVVQSSKGADNLENRVVYNNYDSYGNVEEVSKENGTHIIYLWGYNKQYPIAKLENAVRSAVLANLSGHNTLEGYTETDIVQIENLRSSLVDAMITTYAYKPLVGVISVTDPKGYKVSYEYDQFNRLKTTRDKDNNILSNTEYNYKDILPPLEIKISSSQNKAIAGDMLTFTAVPASGSGNYSFKWTVSNKNLNQVFTTTTGSLNITSTTAHEPGFTVICEVKDITTQDFAVSYPVKVELFKMMEVPDIFQEQKGRIFNLGEQVVLRINSNNIINGSGQYEFTWEKQVQNYSIHTSSASAVAYTIDQYCCPYFGVLCKIKDLVTGQEVFKTINVTDIAGCP
ncbi:RHS repeat domain-containing protein [Flavobacterium reichenbachii]|uniref:Ig-like domain-containing protein n=1 Tax=Flavobacterium reichenbachii TaxID=362418 RepID=A0A085ZFG8_9FLAO|nr:RHS repeat domain-containing protein [Flavobacterium reichenbachii]KFF03182.1 hypothetical protein IW19_19890 [Flavobacterium reichenbachii]OXB15159.1 hypothetical protein B0A68_10530 [Flavobacterium reichenbachii]